LILIIKTSYLGIGDWGLGIWGWGVWAQPPTPTTPTPHPNPQKKFYNKIKLNF